MADTYLLIKVITLLIKGVIEETYEETASETPEISEESEKIEALEEYEEVDESRDFSIHDLTEFIKKTELWIQFIVGKISLNEILKEEKTIEEIKKPKKIRRTRKTSSRTKKEKKSMKNSKNAKRKSKEK